MLTSWAAIICLFSSQLDINFILYHYLYHHDLIFVFILGLSCPLPSTFSSPLSVIIHHTLSLLSHFPHHCHCHCQLFTTFLNISQLCTTFKSVHSASPSWFSVLFSSSLSRSHHLRPDLSIFAPDSLFIELSTGVCYRMNDDAFFPVLRGMTAFDYVGFWKKRYCCGISSLKAKH